jgi:hypothetical protein
MSAQPQVDTVTGEVKQTMYDHAGNYAQLAQMLLALTELEAAPGHETEEEQAERLAQAEGLRVTVEAALEATEGQLGDKVDGLVWLVLELQGHGAAAEAMRREVSAVVERYMRRRNSYENRVKGLKLYLGRCLDLAELKQVKGQHHKAMWVNGKDALTVAEGGEATVVAEGFGQTVVTVALPGDTDAKQIGKLLELATDIGGHVTSAPVVDHQVLYANRNVLPKALDEVVTVTPTRHVKVS